MGKNLSALKKAVYQANMDLQKSGLVLYTFGNVSGVDRSSGIMAIKPSGVDYADLTPEDMVLVSLATGKTVEGKLNPSSDTPTHLELYRAFACGGVVHTHSSCATALAQARLSVRCAGTTHADYFHGDIPVTRTLTKKEVQGEYEKNTGLAIVDSFRKTDPMDVPAVLVANHGPFTWGKDPEEALHHAVVLEYLAAMELKILSSGAKNHLPGSYLIDKHFYRKHGTHAYYGQKNRAA